MTTAGRSGCRHGLTFVELLVVILLTATVVPGIWSLVAGQRTTVERLRRITEYLHASRVTRSVLGAELAAGVYGRDWEVAAPGVVPLRAFRGWGAVCESLTDDEIVVEYRGLRLPNPTKDSLLVLDVDGTWWPEALTSRVRHTGECGGRSVPLERLRLGGPRPNAVLARVFERGEYHLTDGVLRYRLGLAGRQPLTVPAFDPDRTTIEPRAEGVWVRVEPSDTARRGWRLLVRGWDGS